MKTINYSLIIIVCLLCTQCSNNSEKTQEGVNTTISASEVKPQANTKTYYVLAAAGLRMRAAASLNSKEVETIKYGEEVQVDASDISDEIEVNGIKGKMAKVDHDGKEGYMFTGYLSSIPVPKIPTDLIDTEGYINFRRHLEHKLNYASELKQKGVDATFETVKDEETETTRFLAIPAQNIQEAFLIGQRLNMFEVHFDLPSTSSPKSIKIKVDGETFDAKLSNVEEKGTYKDYSFDISHDKYSKRLADNIMLSFNNEALISIQSIRYFKGGSSTMTLSQKGDFHFVETSSAH